ncbi:endopeptidase La, partial [Buchnera aphidicola]|nr:endopeptidase La [Buchnera aphidicola]
VEGLQRASIKKLINYDEYFIAEVELINSKQIHEKEKKVLIRTTINRFELYIKLNKKIPIEILNTLNNINNAEKLADTIAAHMSLKLQDKQAILEICNIDDRLEFLMAIMETEIDLLEVEKKIRNRVKQQIEKSQKEYYLNEQIKAIHKELGEMDEILNEHEIFIKKIKMAKMPKEAKVKTELELKKLKIMPSMSAEATVVRNYIDWMIKVPWSTRSKTKKNIQQAKKILDTDHFGLEKVKERILEYLAVQTRMNKAKGPILCLIGPPGVGKTSLGQSIAKSTGRKYVKMALGGIRDEAEIRGHRRTYIGSMPGRLMQKMVQVKVKNPLFLLDEIDKMSFDIRVDPASALLEVLDPEQNMNFNDHYLETDYDLSEIMFLATSNSTNIPAPLLDRMEIIHLPGYTENEKLNIAKRYLYPKQIERNALKKDEITITDCAIMSIIYYYTREAGVRNLEREISKICRKVVKNILLDKNIKHIEINKKNIKKFLGIKRFNYNKRDTNNQIGQVVGLAWTEIGGELLTIETACVSGKGKLTYTGSLGEVMQESIQAALTVVRSQAKK